jgi:hypothetical protein
MGLGVFAGRDILDGEILDEYFGELLPQLVATQRENDDYVFQIANVASSSSRDYGNWTRFVNHRCANYNVDAIQDVMGGRRTVTFRARGNISKGTQLFMYYGETYFGDADSDILCRCPDFARPHLPPKQRSKKRKANKEAFPLIGRDKRQKKKTAPDVSITEKNTWITENKDWLNKQAPNGYPHWTNVHWRLLEQLIRRRRNYRDWQDKREFRKLQSSRSDELINQHVTTRRGAQMAIKAWHLDVTKAFERDDVCGSRQGVPWGTDELLKRVFALIVAARRRRRRSGRKRSRSITPPIIEAPVKPWPSGTATGDIPSPPATARPKPISRMLPTDYPILPIDF